MLFLITLTCLIFDNAFADRGFYEKYKNNQIEMDRRVNFANFQQMINWFGNIARNGNVEIQVLLGDTYFYGWNTNVDYNEAKKWYKMAAKNDNRGAQRKLAYMYEHGLGGRQSSQKSAYWSDRAQQ